jgi:hypothetical protein
MTAVNETLELCEKRKSKNVLVSYIIDLVLNNLDRKFECPLSGQYNISVDFSNQKDVFKYVPPFMRGLKGSSLVNVNLITSTKDKGELIEFGRVLAFVKVSMK